MEVHYFEIMNDLVTGMASQNYIVIKTPQHNQNNNNENSWSHLHQGRQFYKKIYWQGSRKFASGMLCTPTFHMKELKPEQVQRDIAVFVGELYSQEQEHSLQSTAGR